MAQYAVRTPHSSVESLEPRSTSRSHSPAVADCRQLPSTAERSAHVSLHSLRPSSTSLHSASPPAGERLHPRLRVSPRGSHRVPESGRTANVIARYVSPRNGRPVPTRAYVLTPCAYAHAQALSRAMGVGRRRAGLFALWSQFGHTALVRCQEPEGRIPFSLLHANESGSTQAFCDTPSPLSSRYGGCVHERSL